MRPVVVAAVFSAALAAVGAAHISQDPGRTGSLDRAFAPDGRINMDLSAGDYRISGSPGIQDSRIRMDWKVRESDQLAKVKARVDVKGSDATITTDSPSNSGFTVRIQVPAQTDLYVRLTAGDLRVEGIRGNKDIELHAGDLDIDVGRPEDYRHVEASLWAGDLTAKPFNIVKGGLFRSFDWNGKGPYRLHAHLKAGDIRLFTKPQAEAER